MILNEKGFDVLMDFLKENHVVFSKRMLTLENVHAWARMVEENEGVVELKSWESVSGHTVGLTLWPECFDASEYSLLTS
jgi:hypothetical protein